MRAERNTLILQEATVFATDGELYVKSAKLLFSFLSQEPSWRVLPKNVPLLLVGIISSLLILGRLPPGRNVHFLREAPHFLSRPPSLRGDANQIGVH